MTHRIVAVAMGLAMTIAAADNLRGADAPAESIVWKIDNLKQIGGHAVQVLGAPRVVDAPAGKAVEFDGQDDGLLLDLHPLAGAKLFTAEVIFRPDPDGLPEQRFFHLQENDSENRVLFETRLRPDGQWFLDTYVLCGPESATLFAEKFLHPVGQWYHAALVVDGQEMRHYVNGKLEMAAKLAYQPQRAGKTSIGVRANKVFWFKGAMRTARFTQRVLEPADFLKP